MSADDGALTASAKENPDLFWAMRGGGGNFGVATAFEFQLHEVGPEVFCGLIVRPFEEAAEYMRFYRERVASAPPELSAWTVIRHPPPLPFLPAEAHGELVLVTAFLHLGKEQEGRELVEPLLGFGRPHGASLGQQPYVDWQQGFDALNAPGARNYWKSHNLAELSDGAIDAILEHAARLPSPQCELFVPHLGGAVRRVPAESTAYAHRDAEFVLNVHTRWEEPADDQRCIGWARELFDAVAPHATGGTYVNFLGDEGRHRVHDAYPGEAWERLVGVKRRYGTTPGTSSG